MWTKKHGATVAPATGRRVRNGRIAHPIREIHVHSDHDHDDLPVI